jgi:hypothetical protein
VRTVPETGWSGKRIGELLALAATEFDVSLRRIAIFPISRNLEPADSIRDAEQVDADLEFTVIRLLDGTHRLDADR